MKKYGVLLSFCFLAVSVVDAAALQRPRSISTDSRIQTMRYSENEVFRFLGYYGYQTLIEFEVGEDIQSVAMGDSVAWQLNPAGNRLFIKPIDQNPVTNMTVITNRRVYNFELHAEEAKGPHEKNMAYVLRFIYPEVTGIGFAHDVSGSSVPDLTDPEVASTVNMKYSVRGVENISPVQVFDDGEFTYFKFRDVNADIPAFFMVDGNGNEAIINFRSVKDYIVVERVAARFTLRLGAYVVCIYNENMKVPARIEEEKPWYDFW
jgi:type IV secretion system protein VirB9